MPINETKTRQKKNKAHKRFDDDLVKQPGDIFPEKFLCLMKTNQFPRSLLLKLVFMSFI